MMKNVFLGLGSNLGERIQFIENAIKEIKNIEGTSVIKSSLIYDTEPWGNINQDNYLNSVLEIETDLQAEELLIQLKLIEKKTGRSENKRWLEREIDIDILFYGNEIIENDFVKIPHIQIEKRKFVLIPMAEIAPEFIHPELKKSVSRLLKETDDNLKVNVYQTVKI